DARRVCPRSFSGCQLGQRIAFFVQMNIAQTKLDEAVEEPVSPGRLPEGRRGDADHLYLPLPELRLVQMQPVKGAMDRGQLGKAGDTLMGGRGHQYSTSTRKSPLAGAVGPAAERLRSPRIAGMESAGRRPRP